MWLHPFFYAQEKKFKVFIFFFWFIVLNLYICLNKHAKTKDMEIQIRYYADDENELLGFIETTNTFRVKEKLYGCYELENGWYVSYKYSPDGDWEITEGCDYISCCSKPIEL